MRVDWFAWWVFGLIVISLTCVLLFRLTPNARLRRRRRKSHSRIVSRARRPAVRLSVRPPKDE
jgi:hypothetical protein